MNGEFQIVKKIGTGGMGSVYEASQQSIQRKVAVKILHRKLSERRDLASRFHREAAAMRRLRHPNVARVFFYGAEEADSLLFIVMEHIAGRNLHQLVKAEGPLPAARAVSIVAQAARALSEAHALGMVHRDLKPENLMVCTEGAPADFVKLLDFGLAKVTQEELRADSVALTKEGMIFGTPEFMSPEQARGELLDARSDIYSLAVILYEALTGLLPFEAKHANAFLQLHIEQPPIPLRTRAPHIEVSAELERVILGALAKKPADRPQSAAAFAEALERAVMGGGAPAEAAEAAEPAEPATPAKESRAGLVGFALRALGIIR